MTAEALHVVMLHSAVRRDSDTIWAGSPHMLPSVMFADQSFGERLNMPGRFNQVSCYVAKICPVLY